MARTKPSKPTALRLLHGDRRDRIPTGEPVPAAEPISPPAELDADALAVWNQLAPDLERKGVLTFWDAGTLGIYCQALAYARKAEAIVNASNVVLVGQHSRQEVVRNPALVVFRDMSELALRAGSRLGLTPSDRAQLATGKSSDPLPGEHLLSQ